MFDYCKSLFFDLKFVDILCKFCAEDEPQEQEGGELKNGEECKRLILSERVSIIENVLQKLPMIVEKAPNVSSGIYQIMSDKPDANPEG